MMQKVVIKFAVQLDQKKSRSKALEIVSATSGKIESIAFKGEARDVMEVIAEIDSVKLGTLLRKKVGGANLEQVGPAPKQQEEEAPPVVPPAITWGSYMPPSYPIYEIRDPEPSSCIIM